jgi:hypothetical protein
MVHGWFETGPKQRQRQHIHDMRIVWKEGRHLWGNMLMKKFIRNIRFRLQLILDGTVNTQEATDLSVNVWLLGADVAGGDALARLSLPPASCINLWLKGAHYLGPS